MALRGCASLSAFSKLIHVPSFHDVAVPKPSQCKWRQHRPIKPALQEIAPISAEATPSRTSYFEFKMNFRAYLWQLLNVLHFFFLWLYTTEEINGKKLHESNVTVTQKQGRWSSGNVNTAPRLTYIRLYSCSLGSLQWIQLRLAHEARFRGSQASTIFPAAVWNGSIIPVLHLVQCPSHNMQPPIPCSSLPVCVSHLLSTTFPPLPGRERQWRHLACTMSQDLPFNYCFCFKTNTINTFLWNFQ